MRRDLLTERGVRDVKSSSARAVGGVRRQSQQVRLVTKVGRERQKFRVISHFNLPG